jgi:acyl-CoA thioester hydrolase
MPTPRGNGPAFGTRAPIRTLSRSARSIARSPSSAPGDRTLPCRRLHVLPDKQIEIRWRDLDAYGHVNQAVYLTFAEEMLDDWFRRAFGLRPGIVWDYVAARTTIEYHAELTQADVRVAGTVTLVRLGTTSLTAKIALATGDGRVAAVVETVVVAIDSNGRRPRPITEDERAALERTTPPRE